MKYKFSYTDIDGFTIAVEESDSQQPANNVVLRIEAGGAHVGTTLVDRVLTSEEAAALGYALIAVARSETI